MLVDIPSLGRAEGYNKSIPLGLSIVRLPPISSTYSLIASIPKWHREMSIDIWQYVGDVSSIESSLDDLDQIFLRIEAKIDNLSN